MVARGLRRREWESRFNEYGYGVSASKDEKVMVASGEDCTSV